MSHVDEGLLHAYLDGAYPAGNALGAEIEAHLRVCVDCRVRLEEAREIKERSAVVLRHAAPARVQMPPFEEILARRPAAASTEAARRIRRPFWLPPLPLAWAATLILAVGAGWMARELMYRSSPAPAVVGEGAADQAYRATAPESEQAASTAEEDLGRRGEARAADALQPPVLADRAGTDSENAAGRAETARREDARVPGQPVRRDAPAATVPAAPPPAETVARKAAQDSAGRAIVLGERIVTSGNALAQLSRAADQAAAAADGSFPIRDAAEVLRGEAAEVFLPVARAARLVDLLNDEMTASATSVWTELPANEVDTPAAPTAPPVQGAMRLHTEVARLDGRVLLKTTYRLADGALVELIGYAAPPFAIERQEAREAAPGLPTAGVALTGLAGRSALYAGQTVIWIRRSDQDMLLRGALSEDNLRALASRVRR